MNQLRAVIFDVDGTLVDSERDGHRVAFNQAFAEAGLPDSWDVELYGDLIRTAGGAQRLARWFESQGRTPQQARELASRLHPRKTAIMRELVTSGQLAARPGVRELMDDLDAAGIPMFVATTGTRAWVEPLLTTTFGDRFAAMVTGTEVPDLKPSPAAYQEVIRLIGDPTGVVAIEDSANGVRAAVAAGLPVVAVSNDYTRGDNLTGAELVVDSFEDPQLTAWFRARL